MNAYLLEVTYESGETKTVFMRSFPFSVGREHTNDLMLGSPLVSRRHASIRQVGGRLTIVDNQSRNGVLVNNRAVADEQEVRPGDLINIGPYALRLALTTQPADNQTFSPTETVDYFHTLAGDPVARLTAGLAPAVEGRQALPWDKLLHLLVRGAPEELYASIGEIVEQIVDFDRCFLILFPSESPETMEIVAKRFGATSMQRSTDEVYVSREVLRTVIRTGAPVAVNDSDDSYNITDSFQRSGARNVLCVPITSGRNVFGVLYLDRLVAGRPFQEETIADLAPLMALVSLKIENLRLVETQIEFELNRRELDIAQSIQQRLLPGNTVSLPGYSFEAYSQPCRYVGGDCLDFVVDARGRQLTFTIGDVTGKGLPAALYMVGVLSTLRAYIADGCTLDEAMGKLESYVRSLFAADRFLSLFLAEIDIARGVLTYCNAGHVLPLVFTADGRISELEERAPALNIAPWPDYRRMEYVMAPGDLLLVYTDGITEKMDAKGEMFGKQRLIATVLENADQNLVTIRQAILTSLRSFGSSSELDDDITLILLRRSRGAGVGTDPNSVTEAEILTCQVTSRLDVRDDLIERILGSVAERGFQIDPHFHRLCLDEALSNAVVHGNREDPAKRVTVRVFHRQAAWGVEIWDEGAGFDWQAWIKRLESGLDESRASGRGIALLLKCCTEVAFSDDGRKIQLIWKDEDREATSYDP
jgi:serine phosphatase RsbU (regulator of sigma subunit)